MRSSRWRRFPLHASRIIVSRCKRKDWIMWSRQIEVPSRTGPILINNKRGISSRAKGRRILNGIAAEKRFRSFLVIPDVTASMWLRRVLRTSWSFIIEKKNTAFYAKQRKKSRANSNNCGNVNNGFRTFYYFMVQFEMFVFVIRISWLSLTYELNQPVHNSITIAVITQQLNQFRDLKPR